VDGIGDQFLAGARLAADEHRRRPLRDHPDLVKDAQHGDRMTDQVLEAGALAQRTADRLAFASDRLLFLRGFERQPDMLPDQVGEQLDEDEAFTEQAVFGFVGLHRQHPLQRPADLDRHGDERQLARVEAEPVEKARLVAEASDRAAATAFEDASQQAFAGPIADRRKLVAFQTMDGMHGEVAGVGVNHADHAAAQMAADFERPQHLAQRLREIE
jgi:hypothetical protein